MLLLESWIEACEEHNCMVIYLQDSSTEGNGHNYIIVNGVLIGDWLCNLKVLQ